MILVLVVIAMLSLGAYTFSELMITEYRAAGGTGNQYATLAWAESGVEYVAALLTPDGGGFEENLLDNPSLFHVAVQEGGGFTVVAPLIDPRDDVSMRVGLIDESGKINLNVIAGLDASTPIARNLLLGLPGMTEVIADNILDWIDTDEEAREYGAEADSNSIVPPRNGPLQNLEELLLIDGVTLDLLYGEDANRNGLLDPNEDDGDLSLPYDNADNVLDVGWVEYLTLTSKESNLQHSPDYFGQPRINLNETLLTDLYDQVEERLGPDEALFIAAYRLNGPYDPNAPPSNSGGSGNPEGGGAPAGSGGSGGNTGGSSSGPGGSGGGSGSPGTSGGSGTPSGSGTSGGNSSGSSGGSEGSSSTRSASGLSPQLSRAGTQSTTGSQSTDEALMNAASELAKALGGASGAVTRGGLDLSAGPKTTISSIYELVGAQVSATIDGQETILDSPWKSDPGSLQQDLPELLDSLSTVSDEQISGRININTAPLPVLVGIPGMPAELPDQIISARMQRQQSDTAGGIHSPSAGWLLIEGLVDVELMAKLDMSITGGGHVYQVQVVGHGDQIGTVSRVEAIIDATQPVPTVLSFRNLSNLGPGYRHSELPRFTDSAVPGQNNR